MKKLVVVCVNILWFTFAYIDSQAIIRDVPAAYSGIQAALNDCSAGDTVLVQPGTYFENIFWPAIPGIKLMSSGGSSITNINGGGIGRVISITSSVVDTTTIISGFTISGGYDSNGPIGTASGAGIFLTDASVTMEDLTIIDNHLSAPTGFAYGAGIYLNNSSSRIRNCKINSNTIDSTQSGAGAGAFISAGYTKFQNVEINYNNANVSQFILGTGMCVENSSSGSAIVFLEQVKITNNYSGDSAIYYYGNGLYADGGYIDMINVLIASNISGAGSFHYRGGGMHLAGWTEIDMRHVTVTDNSRSDGGFILGSGIYISGYSVSMRNCIFSNPNTGNELEVDGPYAGIAAYYCNIRGGFPGTNIIDTIPGFVSTTDFHLTPVSPCAGIGNSNYAPLFDLDGNPRPLPALTNPDLGCYEIDQSLTSLSDTESGNFYAYPNPVINGGKLYLSDQAGLKYEIYEMSGSKIAEGYIADNNSIKMPRYLSEGIYLIRIKDKVTKILVTSE